MNLVLWHIFVNQFIEKRLTKGEGNLSSGVLFSLCYVGTSRLLRNHVFGTVVGPDSLFLCEGFSLS